MSKRTSVTQDKRKPPGHSATLEAENNLLRARIAELEKALAEKRSGVPASELGKTAGLADLISGNSAQEALRKSDRLYRAIAESIDYGIWVCDPDGRNLYASQSFLNLVGITQEQCSNFGWGDTLHPDEAERTIAAWKECVRTGGNWDVEHRFKGVDGQWHEVLARGVPVRDENGRIECWAGINLDIRALKRAEQERDSLTRDLTNRLGELRAVLDAAPVAIWMAHDPECRRITGNDCADQIMRVSRGGNVSRSAGEPDAAVSYRVFQQGLELQSQDLPAQKSAATGKPVAEQEYEVLFADGRRLNLLMGARPLFDREGRVRGAVAAGADVTGLRRAEQALRETEARFRIMADSSPMIIWVTDAEGGIMYVNRTCREFFGITGENAQEANWQSFIHPEDLQATVAAFSLAVANRTALNAQVRARRSDGEWRWIAAHALPRWSPNQEFVGFVGIGPDITEHKASEAAFLRQQHQLQALTSRLITVQEAGAKQLARELHDGLSQKVAAAALEISAIDQRSLRAPRSVREGLRRVAHRIEDLGAEIRQMARLLHPAILDDLGLVLALKSECLVFSAQRDSPVDFRAAGEMPASIPEDVSLCLYRVTQECLRNIARHAGKTPVEISLTATGAEICLSVRDSGCGFAYNAAATRRGLGLISMEERVKLLNGHFSIHSQPGKGACVEVRIPCNWKGI